MAKGLRCRLDRHAWVRRETPAGEPLAECRRCGKRHPGPFPDDGIGVPGKWVGGGLGPWGVPGGH
jgi:hypothetical protein